MVFYGKLIYCTNCIYSFQAKPWTLTGINSFMLVYVGKTLFSLWAISLPPIKLFHDTGESMNDMEIKMVLERFKPIEHSLDIYSLTYAVSQFTRTSARKEQNSTNISKTTCQKLANEKRSLNSINYHNPNRKCVFCWCLSNTLPFTGVCKRFIFLRIFTIHYYYSCAQHFPRLIFASAFCAYE